MTRSSEPRNAAARSSRIYRSPKNLLKLFCIAFNRVCFIVPVDDLARVEVVAFLRADIVADLVRFVREQSVAHAERHDFVCNLRLNSLVWLIHEVSADEIAQCPVIVLPGDLNVASPAVLVAVPLYGISVGLCPLSAPSGVGKHRIVPVEIALRSIFSDRMERISGLMLDSGQHVRDDPDLLYISVGLDERKQLLEASDLLLLELSELGSVRYEELLAIELHRGILEPLGDGLEGLRESSRYDLSQAGGAGNRAVAGRAGGASSLRLHDRVGYA